MLSPDTGRLHSADFFVCAHAIYTEGHKPFQLVMSYDQR